MIVSWKGRRIPHEEVVVSAFDGGLLRGEGIFETMLAEDGVVNFWPRHLERLHCSAALLGLEPPTERFLHDEINGVLEDNDLVQGEARVRLTLTSDVLLTAVPVSPRTESAVVNTVNFPINERSPLATAKTTSYAENMLALRASGADEAIRPNTQGQLCEGAMSNVFFVHDGQLKTPSLACGCLPGIVRSVLLELGEVEEGCWSMSILDEVEELWLTSSIRRMTWVGVLNGRELGAPSPRFETMLAELRDRSRA